MDNHWKYTSFCFAQHKSFHYNQKMKIHCTTETIYGSFYRSAEFGELALYKKKKFSLLPIHNLKVKLFMLHALQILRLSQVHCAYVTKWSQIFICSSFIYVTVTQSFYVIGQHSFWSMMPGNEHSLKKREHIPHFVWKTCEKDFSLISQKYIIHLGFLCAILCQYF